MGHYRRISGVILLGMSDPAGSSEDEPLEKAYDSQLLWRLLGYVKPHRALATLAVLLIVLSAFLQLVGPLATAVGIDLYIRPAAGVAEGAAGSNGVSRWVDSQLTSRGIELDPDAGLLAIAAVYLGSILAAFFVLALQSYVMQLMGQRIMLDMRREIFSRLQRLDVSYFDRRPIGRLVTRVTNDVDSLNELFTSGLVSVIGDILLLVSIIAVLFWLNWSLAIVTFAIVPLLIVITFWFRKRARESYREVRVKLARINSFLQEHITGMSVVQLFDREKQAREEFSEINREHRDANVRAIFYYGIYYPGVELVTAIGGALILWYGGSRVMTGAISLGALVAFLQYAQRFYRPLSDLSEKYNILQSAMASSERIFRLIDTEPDVRSLSTPTPRLESGGRIGFDRVSFSYEEGEPVLSDISFEVEPGQMVAVVGHTGAGKSTLASLLLRFYDVDAGAIRIDGVDVREWDLKGLRGTIGMVLQDVFLFSGTIAGNIGLGRWRDDEERLRWAAKEVDALGFIERLPGGFDAPVQERGAGLSVGQKQLISFARALAFDPKILILDEATSSIDTETEQKIQLALARLLKGRTSLVIAHRLSTIQRADRILVLHKGELRESGTHQELLALRGIYYRLYQLQYREQEAS